MTKQVFLVLSISLSLALLATGALAGDTNQVALVKSIQSMAQLDDRQVLGPGDQLTYRVIEDQDEPRTLTVTDSGEVQVPYLGLVKAAGKTSAQLARDIKGLLEKSIYYQATVIIAVEVVNKTRVTGRIYVTGQVRNSGSFEIPAHENLTVSKAVLKAGGFSDFSDKKRVRLIRKTSSGEVVIVVNVQEIWDKGKIEKDVLVKPDDTIVVPARLVNF